MCIQAFWTEISADRLNTVLDDLLEELKITKRQRIREIMKRPEQETLIQSSQNREDKVFRVHVISNGDPPQDPRGGFVLFAPHFGVYAESGIVMKATKAEVQFSTSAFVILYRNSALFAVRLLRTWRAAALSKTPRRAAAYPDLDAHGAYVRRVPKVPVPQCPYLAGLSTAVQLFDFQLLPRQAIVHLAAQLLQR